MQTRQLGNSDLNITPIGFGAWAIGGAWKWGWGHQDDQASIDTIHRALDLGINWIDTAAIYGLGHSEEIIAKALKGRTSKPYVFTKCSMIWDDQGEVGRSLKRDSIRREAEDSLRRLAVDVIDLYQIHWPIPDPDIEEAWQTLADLKAEGKIRHIGVSNFNVGQLKRAQQIAPVASLQPPYSAIERRAEAEILSFCREQNIGVIVYSPMQAGLLTGKMTRERLADLPDDDWRRANPNFQEPRLSRNLALADVLVEIGKRHGKTAATVAVAWTLNNPAVTGAIVGARRPDQIDDFIDAGEFRLTQEDVEEIAGFIRDNP
jgi:aryl-alcohol dehydrogenase-like predicted oxidoreductase